MGTKTFSTLDIYLSAFLSLHNLEPTLEIRNRKIVFTFEATDNLYRLMNDFNSNEPVEVADYTTAIKTLRGKMLTAKEGIHGHEKVNGYGTKEIKL
jgi:hypothetical protein